jgi:hypothetical protein
LVCLINNNFLRRLFSISKIKNPVKTKRHLKMKINKKKISITNSLKKKVPSRKTPLTLKI